MMEGHSMSLEVDSVQRSSVGGQFYPLDNVLASTCTVSEVPCTDFLSEYRKFLTEGIHSAKEEIKSNDIRLPNTTGLNCTDLDSENDETEESAQEQTDDEVCPNVDSKDTVNPVDICVAEESSLNEDGKTLIRAVNVKLKKLSPKTMSSPQRDYISRFNIRPSYVLLKRLPVDFSDLVKNYCKVVTSLSNSRNNSSSLENNKENEVQQSLNCTNETNDASLSNKSPNVYYKHVNEEKISKNYQQKPGKHELNEKCRKVLFRRGSDSKTNGKIGKFQHRVRGLSTKLSMKQNKEDEEHYEIISKDFNMGNEQIHSSETEPKRTKRPYNRRKNVNDSKNIVNTNNNMSRDNTFQKCLRVRYPKVALETTNNVAETINPVATTKRKYNKDNNNTFQRVKRKYVRKQKLNHDINNSQFYDTPSKCVKLEERKRQSLRTNCITKGIKHDNMNLRYNQMSTDISNMYTSCSMRKPRQMGDLQRFNCVNKPMKSRGNKSRGYDGRFNECHQGKCKGKSKFIQVYNNEDDSLHLYEDLYDDNSKYSHNCSYEQSIRGKQYCKVNAGGFYYQPNSEKLKQKNTNRCTRIPISTDLDDMPYNSDTCDYGRSGGDTYMRSEQYGLIVDSSLKPNSYGIKIPRKSASSQKSKTQKIKDYKFQPLRLSTLAVKTFLCM